MHTRTTTHLTPLLALFLSIFSLQAFSPSAFCAEGAPALTAKPLSMRMVQFSLDLWTNPKKTTEARALIDRVVSEGYNAVDLGPTNFMPIYFVDYTQTPYPEAIQCPPAQIETQVNTVRANMRYAKSKGIRTIIIRAYSFYYPYRYWKAHQADYNPNGIFTRFLENAHQSDHYQKALKNDAPDSVIPYAQWSNPAYKKFYTYSFERMLDVLPELDGFEQAYAEVSNTLRLDILEKNTWKDPKEAFDADATDENFIDWVNTLHQILAKKRPDRGFLGVRDWYTKPSTLARLNFPTSQLCLLIKYAGFDQPLVNYPPWGKELLDKGFRAILDIEIYDAEHPFPLYWYDNDIIEKIFANMYTGGFNGFNNHDFTLKTGKGDSYDNPVRVLAQKTTAAAFAQKPFTDADAIAFLTPYYGQGAPALLRSLKDVSRAQETYIKLSPAWFWRGDGLTPFGAGVSRAPWQLMDNPEAPPGMAYVRQDAISITDYVNATHAAKSTTPTDAQLAAWKTAGKKTPIEMIAHMRQLADDAVAAATELRAKSPKNAPYLRDVVASPFIHRELVLRDTAFLESAIHFYRTGATFDAKYNKDKTLPNPPPPGVDIAAEKAACAEAMQRVMYHDKILGKLLQNYAPRLPTRKRAGTFVHQRSMSSILGIPFTEPPLDNAEYKRIESQILGK